MNTRRGRSRTRPTCPAGGQPEAAGVGTPAYNTGIGQGDQGEILEQSQRSTRSGGDRDHSRLAEILLAGQGHAAPRLWGSGGVGRACLRPPGVAR